MDKRPLNVEWQIAHSDAEWERLQGARLPESEPAASRQRPLPRYLWRVAALLLLLASVGGGWWRPERATLPPPTASVTATAQPDLGLVVQQDARSITSVPGHLSGMDWWYQHQQEVSGLRAAVQNNAPAAHIDMALPRIELHGDQAVVSVVTTAPDGRTAYRQTRFYRRTAAGWLRTEPDAALWGPARSLETPSFVFHFRQQDATVVIAVAPQIEELYTTLRRNFGLPISLVDLPTMSGGKKLVIEVSVTQSPGNARFQTHYIERFVLPDRWVVASPAVYLAPVELTGTELLAQSVALPLIEQMLASAKEHHAIDPAWQPLVSGLRLWQVWDLDLPLAAWQEEIVRWIYVDLPTTRPGQAVVLPDHYRDLCVAYQLWLPSPTQLEIPLVCSSLDRQALFFLSLGSRDPLTQLDQLALPIQPNQSATYLNLLFQVQLPTRTVALATLVEYAVATYGRERLPLLVAGLGQYESWDTLLPPVFGVSAAEFEAGWQTYLATHYGVAVEHEHSSE